MGSQELCPPQRDQPVMWVSGEAPPMVMELVWLEVLLVQPVGAGVGWLVLELAELRPESVVPWELSGIGLVGLAEYLKECKILLGRPFRPCLAIAQKRQNSWKNVVAVVAIMVFPTQPAQSFGSLKINISELDNGDKEFEKKVIELSSDLDEPPILLD